MPNENFKVDPSAFNPTNISASIVANILTIILQHHADRLQDTQLGELFKNTGLIEPNFADQIKALLAETVKHFFHEHSEYERKSTLNFFSDEVILKTLVDNILDDIEIDNNLLEKKLKRYIDNEPQDKWNLTSSQILIEDFLESFEHMLRGKMTLETLPIFWEFKKQRKDIKALSRQLETSTNLILSTISGESQLADLDSSTKLDDYKIISKSQSDEQIKVVTSSIHNQIIQQLCDTNQFDTATSLVINKIWVETCKAIDGNSFDGYIYDLEIVWKSVQTKLLQQIQHLNTPISIVDSVRLALSRTQINTMAESYTPEFVKRALEVGYWTPQYALSIANKLPEPNRHFVILETILESNKLNSKQRQYAEHEIVAILKQLVEEQVISGNIGIRIEALTPHIESEQAIRDLYDVAISIYFKSEKALALASILPRLPQAERAQILDEQLTIIATYGDLHNKLGSIEHLAPIMNTEQANRALQIIINEQQSIDFYGALENLAKSLDKDGSVSALEIALEVKDEKYLARIIANLIPNVPVEKLQEIRNITEKLASPENRLVVLVTIINQLDGAEQIEIIEEVFTTSKAIEKPYVRSSLLLSSVYHKIPAEHENYRVQALELSFNASMFIRDNLRPQIQFQILYELSISRLSDELLEKNLESLLENRWYYYSANALASLLQYLPDEYQESATIELSERIDRLVENEEVKREDCVKWMSGLLTSKSLETPNKIISDAFEIIENISNINVRNKAINYLLSNLESGDLSDVERLMVQLGDPIGFSATLGRLARYIDGNLRETAVHHALKFGVSGSLSEPEQAMAIARLAPYLKDTLLDQALDKILSFESEVSQSGVLAILAEESNEVSIDHLFGIAKSFEREDAKSQLLSYLAPKLKGKDIALCLELAMRMEISHHTTDIFTKLRDSMSKDQIAKTLEKLEKNVEPLKYVQVVGALLKQDLEDGSYRELIENSAQVILDTPLEYENSGQIVLSTVAIIELLNNEVKYDLLDHALKVALIMHSNWMSFSGNSVPQAEALVKIAPYLTGSQVVQAIKATDKFTQSLGLFSSSPSIQPKFRVLSALASQMNHEQWTRTLNMAFNSDEAWETVYVFESMPEKLPPDLVQRIHEEIPNINGGWQRARAWLAVQNLNPKPDEVLQKIQQAIAEHLREIANSPRETLLLSLDVQLFTPEIIGKHTIDKITETICELASSELS